MNEGLNIDSSLTEQTIAKIKVIENEVNVMGANDFEIPALENLIKSLEKKECTPEDAIKQAINIRDTKQDYH